jgi:hypothetical protein
MSKANDIATWGQYQPQRRNILINGGFNVAQRGTSFTGIAASEWTLDRWNFIHSSSTGVVSVSQGTINPAVPGVYHYYLITVTTADTSIAAAEATGLEYKFEGLDTSQLKWGTFAAHDVTLSFWSDHSKTGTYSVSTSQLKWGTFAAHDVTLSFWSDHSKTGTYSVSLRSGGFDRSYVTEYTQDVANVWQKHTITIPGPTSGTFATNNTKSFILDFSIAMGTDNTTTTLDEWFTGNKVASTNQVNGLDSNTNLLRFAAIQLEEGTEATDFEYRHYSDELALCQRYYHRVFTNAGGSVWYRYATAGLAFMFAAQVTFPVSMRIAPARTDLTALTLTNCSTASWTSTAVDASLSVTVTATAKYRALVNDTEFDAEL